MKTTSDRRRGGFTLLEIMAAIALLAIVFTILMQVRQGAVLKATRARTHSIAVRLGNMMLNRIEAGLVPDLIDGSEGDFTDQGFGKFSWQVGLGDGSRYTGGADVDRDPVEEVWRNFRENIASEEDEEGIKPEYTRVFLTVRFPDLENGEDELDLETLIPTWAVEQDFQLYRAIWPDLTATELD